MFLRVVENILFALILVMTKWFYKYAIRVTTVNHSRPRK